MGADVARQLLALGLADELHLELIPLLLGRGERLFPEFASPVPLAQLSMVEGKGISHLKFRIHKNNGEQK